MTESDQPRAGTADAPTGEFADAQARTAAQDPAPPAAGPAPGAGPEPEPEVSSSGKDAETMATYGLTSKEVAILRQSVCLGAPIAWIGFFMTYCRRAGFDPFKKHVYLTQSRAREYSTATDKWDWVTKWQIVTGIDGYRTISARSPLYRGISRPVWTKDHEGRDYCEVVIKRAIAGAPFDAPPLEFYGIAYLDEFEQRKAASTREIRDGEGNLLRVETVPGELVGQWAKMGSRRMISVRAEVDAHRKAFPEENSGLMLDDEVRDSFLREELERTAAARGTAIVPVAPPEVGEPERTEDDEEIDRLTRALRLTPAVANVKLRAYGGSKQRLLEEYLRPQVERMDGVQRGRRDPTAPLGAADRPPREADAQPAAVDEAELIEMPAVDADGNEPCPECGGNGFDGGVQDAEAPCGVCSGSGKLRADICEHGGVLVETAEDVYRVVLRDGAPTRVECCPPADVDADEQPLIAKSWCRACLKRRGARHVLGCPIEETDDPYDPDGTGEHQQPGLGLEGS